jgi:hypothetical protein
LDVRPFSGRELNNLSLVLVLKHRFITEANVYSKVKKKLQRSAVENGRFIPSSAMWKIPPA